jgi:hypothetical protein
MNTPPEVAFYYPGPVWYHSEAMKNLLLFFDGIALLVPEYLLDKPEHVDPSLAIPLREQGLLHVLKPEELLDQGATEELATHLADIIHSGLLDELSNEGGEFHELSMSRLGYDGDASLAKMLFEELKARGLAKDSQDGFSIPMHPQVRYLILVLLAQILRPRGDAIGLNLLPATDRPQLVGALLQFLGHGDVPSAGNVVGSDLLTVGVDLSTVPLDEVLGFRKEHLREHRAYANAVRAFVRDLSQIPEGERARELAERQSELDQLSADLRAKHRVAWRKPASFALGAAGAVWTATTGDPWGAILTAGSLVTGLTKNNRNRGGAFSYLFSARSRFGY